MMGLVTNDDVTVTVNAAPSVNIVYGDANEDGRFTIDDIHLAVEWLIGQVPLPEAGTAA